MNALEKRINEVTPHLYVKFLETKATVDHLLDKYSANFPTYTDHSSKHTLEVFNIASELISEDECKNLNGDEAYILSMACLLHDIGMCIPEDKIEGIANSEEIKAYKKSHPNLTSEEFIRDIHHTLSRKFIEHEWELLKIPTEKYATAIGLVAEGHRKVDIGNFEIYNPNYFVKNGKDYVCLPYLASILRLADELDVTNSRTPRILTKYYLPNNEVSIREWNKHISTLQRNYLDEKIIFEVNCTDHNIYAALQEQFDKIQSVINLAQKITRSIPSKSRHFSLSVSSVEVKYKFIGFDPKGIRFSFNVENVVTAFIGEDLYKDKMTSFREALQNSIDSCRYKLSVIKEEYSPKISVTITDEYIQIEDNGAGMDEFIIENFFGRLASSFYEQEKIKSQFEAIGQFGVGVFSYFLLSDYVDIETKTKNSKPLKFRFDKDPKSYFHFYDNPCRKEAGTTITMYLKKDLQSKISFSQISQYINTIFKHVEIPIQLISNKEDVQTFEFQACGINAEKEIRERLKLQDKREADKHTIKRVSLNNEFFEGECGIIISTSKDNPFEGSRLIWDYDYFRTANDSHGHSQISISQKGIFVNFYSSSMISFMIGEINLKKKIKINIDRNKFSDLKEIHPILDSFSTQILKEIFSDVKQLRLDKEKYLAITKSLFETYSFTPFYKPDFELKELLRENIYLKTYLNDAFEILSVDEILSKYDEFILVSDLEDYKVVSTELNMPVVIADGYSYSGTYRTLNVLFLNVFDHNRLIYHNGSKNYNKLIKGVDDKFLENVNELYSLFEYYHHSFAKSNSESLCISIWKNKELSYEQEYLRDEFYFNYNHPLVQFVIEKIPTIKQNTKFVKLVRSVFDFSREIFLEDELSDQMLLKINEMVHPLYEIGFTYSFIKKDFVQQ